MTATVATLDPAFVAAFGSGQVSQGQLEAILPAGPALDYLTPINCSA